MVPRSISHYRIIKKLGEGGMGEVYLAEDMRLDRKVAIKLLLSEFVANDDRLRRFVQEAKAAAALTHPNIAHIYEVGEADGTHYIAMEFVDGDTLTTRAHRDKNSLATLLKYLSQVAEGLAKAHAAGIVHRDLKPDNIMITRDGYTKILDFGLAKLVENRTSAISSEDDATVMMPARPLSVAGAVMGTVGYMSPEQAQGKPIDQRSDIFSFGCILFEAATGRRAFEGDSAIDTLHKIIYSAPPQIRDFNPDAPADLQRVIRRCLEKDPQKRYQTIIDVINDLEELRREIAVDSQASPSLLPRDRSTADAPVSQTASDSQLPSTSSAEYLVSRIKKHKRGFAVTAAVLLAVAMGIGYWFFTNRATGASEAIDSIAVLPFENRSSDADTEYLSEGLAESLIYRLSQLPDLKVSPTSSAFRYKGKETDAQKIGSELGVQAVMTGRIVQRGDNLTISVELVDVRNNKLIWGEQYERKISELLATQREIAAEITNKLKLKLSGEGEQGLTKRYTDNNEAYQLYLKGRFHYAKRGNDLLKGIEYFQEAIKLDPNFALAYVGISESYATIPSYAYLSPHESYPKAKTAAQRALEIDPTLAEAHAALAYPLALYDWNWAEAEREFKRAIELNPNVAQIHYDYALTYLLPTGRADEAAAEIQRALELEPLSLAMSANLARVYMYARQNDRALEQAKKTSALDPNHPATRYWHGAIYNANRMYAEAIALSEKILQIDPKDQGTLSIAGYAYAKTNRPGDAEAVIKKFKEIEKTQYATSYYIANIYAALGERDEAFAELEKAFTKREYLIPILKVDPLMDDLRDDPRFKEMVKRLNLPE